MNGLKLKKVLEPIKIGSMELRNRFVMPPMVTNFAAEDGSVTDRIKSYYETRAKGGVGLIIVEAVYVHQSGKGFDHQLGIDNDRLIPGLKSLTNTVHRHGAKIAAQLYHAGRQTNSKVTGMTILAPSPIPCPVNKEMPHELSISDIRVVIEQFARAARRAKAAGFDAIEIHGAHGYLLNQFLSPYSNIRTDEYGGPFENRIRFPLEVVSAVRDAVGNDFPLIYRLSSEEFVEGGLTIEDTKEFAKILVDAGIDALHVSGGVYESGAMITAPQAVKQGLYVKNADAIKKEIRGAVPVIVVGRIKDPLMAEEIIREGKADLVAMGRALLGDPEMPKKVAANRLEEIRKCIGCNQGCIDRLNKNQDISCMINPLTGHESEYNLDAPVAKKRVLVIGGGPAGLEAAWIAAKLGHDTILYEKQSQLGGQLRVAAKPPFKKEINDLTTFLIHQVEHSGAKIVIGMEADIEKVLANHPDAVIVATGSEPILPNIPGIGQENVVTAHDVLMDRAMVGDSVIIIGGGMVGCETAEYLADQGKQVTIVEMLDHVAEDVGSATKALMMLRLIQKKITVLTNSRVTEISKNTVTIEKKEGTLILPDIDTVVAAVGSKPANKLAKEIEQAGIPVFAIGDCVKPRKIFEAIHEGFQAAYHLGNITAKTHEPAVCINVSSGAGQFGRNAINARASQSVH
jgi:2,4-dienoyl-CoA reductase-like NADH-dependent reductase (Old Yellow Enzyme family)/pyruvate/2-oxoglutarate dehydrogenase complex dihydrolipoamide dehydrogenase (E3) component